MIGTTISHYCIVDRIGAGGMGVVSKRSAATAALLAEEVFEEVGHAQWVFVMPKMLRPYFLHHRELLGGLAHAAWETVLELMCAAAGDEGMRPGMVPFAG